MRLMYGTDGSDQCFDEIKVRAFLRLIKYKEAYPGRSGDDLYKQIVGGGVIKNYNDHPRIPVPISRIGKPSTAAGAYQFLSKSWDKFKDHRVKLGFKEKDFSPLAQDYSVLFYLSNIRTIESMKKHGQVKSWGNVWVNKMIKKWKNEYPNVTKDSFPQYKNRYADAHGDVIQHIIDNNLDRALIAVAPTWASFPDSINGQEASSYTIADAKIKFREYILEELKGETDLYLQPGFLKKLGYNCCSNKNNSITGTSSSGKEPIDLRPTIPWHSQFTADTWGPYSHQSWMCYFTSLLILQDFVGLKAGGARGNKSVTVNGRDLGAANNLIQVALEETESDGFYSVTTPIIENAKTGIAYLDQELEKGNPILVGVRHTYKKIVPTEGHKHEQNHDKSTDHYVIVVGRGCENGKRYFLFYEVGTRNSANGQHDKNRLYVNDDWSITGIPQHNLQRTYTLTQVRGNKTNGNFK